MISFDRLSLQLHLHACVYALPDETALRFKIAFVSIHLESVRYKYIHITLRRLRVVNNGRHCHKLLSVCDNTSLLVTDV